MTSWLTENSTVPMIAGAILTLIFIAFWVHSREKAMLKVAIGVAVITAAIVTCEQMVVTQREEVTDQIYALANSVQRTTIWSVGSFRIDQLVYDCRSIYQETDHGNICPSFCRIIKHVGVF